MTMSVLRHPLALALGALLAALAPLQAQGEMERIAASRWAATVSGGVSLGTSTSDIEAAMRAGGLAETDPGGCRVYCSPSKAFPWSQGNGAGFQAMLMRRFATSPLQFRAAASHTHLGTTTGFNLREGLDFGDYLEVQQRVTAIGVLAGVSALREVVWAAAGPAVYRATLTRIDGGEASDERSVVTRVGGLVALGLDVPLSYPVVLQFQGQYRIIGSPEMGPVREQAVDGSEGRMMPRAAVTLDHALLLMGLGLRF